MARRPPSPLEVAAALAIGGSLIAVAVPTFARNLHASRVSEAMSGVSDIGKGAIAYAGKKGPPECFPPSAPLTPAEVPRAERVVDPPGTWDHLTWHVLGFSINHGHYFAFAFDSPQEPQVGTFTARAHGDLDGDGERSTFEVRGVCEPGSTARLVPGVFVSREVE